MKKLLVVLLFVATPLYGQDWATARKIVAEEGPHFDWASENGMHSGTHRIVERLLCETKDPNWGRKSTNGGPLSGDTIAYRTGPLTEDGRNTPMRVIDFCGGCGASGANPYVWQDFGLITNQRFIPVTVTCEANPPPTKPPPNTPPTAPTVATLDDILRRLTAIEHALGVLTAGQTEQTIALQQAITELKAQVTTGIKIRF